MADDDFIALVSGAVLVLIGAVMFLVSWYHSRDLVDRNPLVGIRTFSTLRSDESWSAAHRAAAPLLRASGVTPLAAGLLLLVWRPDQDAALPIAGVGFAVWFLLVIAAAVRGNDAARDAHRHGRHQGRS